MFPTVNYNGAANRFAPFSDYIDIETLDFSGGMAKLQIRDRPNGGAVCADLTPAITKFVNDGVITSRVSISVPEMSMEAMPLAPEVDRDVTLFWDLHVTPPGGVKFVVFSGTFTVLAGVTE